MRGSVSAALLAGLVGCEPVVGEDCGLRINEVMTGGEFWPLQPNRDEPFEVDWIELYNPTPQPIDLTRYALRLAASALESDALVSVVCSDPDSCGIEGRSLASGDTALGLATTYVPELADLGPALRPASFHVGFDMNNDDSAVELLGRFDEGWAVCQHVYMADQHAGFSWSYQPRDSLSGWCDTAPTPNDTNEACLCEHSSSC